MTVLALLIPVSLILGLGGLAAFVWTLRDGQYDDLEGARHRILLDESQPAGPDEEGSDSGGGGPGN